MSKAWERTWDSFQEIANHLCRSQCYMKRCNHQGIEGRASQWFWGISVFRGEKAVKKRQAVRFVMKKLSRQQ